MRLRPFPVSGQCGVRTLRQAAGQKVLIVDDLLATGGTVHGTIELVERLKGEVVGLAFLVELEFLKGRERLQGYDVTSVIRY